MLKLQEIKSRELTSPLFLFSLKSLFVVGPSTQKSLKKALEPTSGTGLFSRKMRWNQVVPVRCPRGSCKQCTCLCTEHLTMSASRGCEKTITRLSCLQIIAAHQCKWVDETCLHPGVAIYFPRAGLTRSCFKARSNEASMFVQHHPKLSGMLKNFVQHC